MFVFDLTALLYHVRPGHQLFYPFGLIFVVRHIEQYGLSELPKKLTLNKLALIGKVEKSP